MLHEDIELAVETASESRGATARVGLRVWAERESLYHTFVYVHRDNDEPLVFAVYETGEGVEDYFGILDDYGNDDDVPF